MADQPLTARDRKAAARARSREAVIKSRRRSSRVTVYHVKPTAAPVHPVWFPEPQVSEGLSPEAEWFDLKPDNIGPLDWLRFYPGDDKSIWPEAIEEIKWEVEHGTS